MITIIDYGLGNLGSIANMLKKIGARSIISSEADVIEQADKLILPGVGAFDQGMKNLHIRNLIPLLNQKVIEEKTPILGLCLGMQLFAQASEEGELEGLNWVEAKTVRFKFSHDQTQLKVPHMGWNTVQICRPHPLFRGLEHESRFYFVHSYHLVCAEPKDHLTLTHYGYDFPSAIVKENIMGAQFHPEKSHKYGMQLFRNFVELF